MHAGACATTTNGASRGREFETGDMGVARYSGQGSKRDDRTWRQFRRVGVSIVGGNSGQMPGWMSQALKVNWRVVEDRWVSEGKEHIEEKERARLRMRRSMTFHRGSSQ